MPTTFLSIAKHHLRAIQRSDDVTKKRWVIRASILSMVVVVGLWFGYLKLTLPPTNVVLSAAPEKQAENSGETREGFWVILKRGITNISQTAKEGFTNIRGSFQGSLKQLETGVGTGNTFSVEGTVLNPLAPQEEEPIPPTPLP